MGVPVFVSSNRTVFGNTVEDIGPKRYESEDGKISTNSAEDALAQLIRADWDTFKEDDLEYIMDYAKDITDDTYVDRAVGQAKRNVNLGSNSVYAGQKARANGMGVSLSSAQKNDRYKDFKRAKAVSLAGAASDARDSAIDRRNKLIAGSNISSLSGGGS
jgi:hypothetical protein